MGSRSITVFVGERHVGQCAPGCCLMLSWTVRQPHELYRTITADAVGPVSVKRVIGRGRLYPGTRAIRLPVSPRLQAYGIRIERQPVPEIAERRPFRIVVKSFHVITEVGLALARPDAPAEVLARAQNRHQEDAPDEVVPVVHHAEIAVEAVAFRVLGGQLVVPARRRVEGDVGQAVVARRPQQEQTKLRSVMAACRTGL